jgi:hypothetical protein
MKIVNNENLTVGDMRDDRLERKPLPIGKSQAMEWSDRIIEGAAVEADKETQRFALMGMLMQIAPTEAFKEDAYFMLALRAAAVKQTAHLIAQELKEAHEARRKQAEATAPINLEAIDGAVLAEKDV